MDFYGRRVATCSSDRLIKVYDLLGHGNERDGPLLSAELAA